MGTLEKQSRKSEGEKIIWREIKDKNAKGGVTRFRMLDEIVRPQIGMPNKQIHLQQMEFETDGRKEYRFCYYLRKNEKDIYRFSRFTAFLPKTDLKAILQQAREKGLF